MKKIKIIGILITTLLIGMLLVACSNKTDNKKNDFSNSKENFLEDVNEDLNQNKLVADSETVHSEEMTTEMEESAYFPEGVDIYSTLLGEEWIASFDGVVKEPVVVVYNDVTGRKEVIQQNGVVYVNPYEDCIAAHYPEGFSVIRDNGVIADFVDQTLTSSIYYFNAELAIEVGRQEAEIIIGNETEEWRLNFFLIPEYDSKMNEVVY